MNLAAFFTMLGDGVVAFAGMIGDSLEAISPIFWTAGESGGPTFVGTLLIAGGVASIFTFGLNWIQKLIKGSTKAK